MDVGLCVHLCFDVDVRAYGFACVGIGACVYVMY